MDGEGRQYIKPALERFGTFRELTQLGSAVGSDIAAVFGIPAGCNEGDPSSFGCGGGGRS